jgi:RNA polymerase sigma-70 factor, ECF subfamily
MIAAIPINANISKKQAEEEKAATAHAGPVAVPDPSPPPDAAQDVDWQDLVRRIQGNEPAALEQLYHLISRGIKILIVRQLGRQEAEDRVHDTFLVVVRSIQRGELREPERLIAFARTVVRRRILQYMTRPASSKRDNLTGDAVTWIPDSDLSPEESAIRTQNSNIMESVLRAMSRRDQEVLTRFYLLEQAPEQICEEMDLTETQFRLLKSRAKSRFAEEGRKRTAKDSIRNFFVRKSTR